MKLMSKLYNTLKLYFTGWQNEEQGSSWKVVTGGETLARDQLSRRAKIITSPLLAFSEGLKYTNTNRKQLIQADTNRDKQIRAPWQRNPTLQLFLESTGEQFLSQTWKALRSFHILPCSGFMY